MLASPFEVSQCQRRFTAKEEAERTLNIICLYTITLGQGGCIKSKSARADFWNKWSRITFFERFEYRGEALINWRSVS